MQLPLELQNAIDSLVEGVDFLSLRQGGAEMSAAYRQGKGSHKAFQIRAQLLSYLVTRFPATFAACIKVFEEIKMRMPDFSFRRLLDVGAGPGSASWAALQVFGELSSLYLMERESEAIAIGKKLAECGSDIWKQAEWMATSIEEALIPAVDAAVLSYVIGEMSRESVQNLVQRLWKSAVSVIVVVEPGTPRGYQNVLAVREWAISNGAVLVAPCPHAQPCPMKEKDWCHFPARVERTRIHRQMKGGTLGYEDEKFSYVVLARPEMKILPLHGRAVAKPVKGSGYVKIPLCVENGHLEIFTASRKEKDMYRAARDVEWGGGI